VTWVNLDGEQHDALTLDGRLGSPLIDPDGSWTYTFTDPGVYDYLCDLHESMEGTIEVVG
jgi:VCBS repeat-containing protein